jgi:histidinol-phosphate aminotransferase
MPDHISSLPRYVPGLPSDAVAREFGLVESEVVKLASNENPLGMSPAAQSALSGNAAAGNRYPDPDGNALKAALAARLAVEPDWLILGSGSSEILEMAGRAFLAPGKSGLVSQYSFAVYRSAIRMVGATAVITPASEYGHDLKAMAAAVEPGVNLVFAANPNNPTGTYFTQRAFEALMDAVAGRAVVVLDEAYQEYLPQSLQADTMQWLHEHPNLVVTRTFSKIYGLAGLRVGYAVANAAVADLMNRVRQPFNVNSIALAAAAAALDDAEFVARSRALNFAGMAQLTEGFQRLELAFIASVGNFVTVRVGDGQAVFTRLLRSGVIVRPIGGYGLPQHLRVTVGTAEENDRVLQALEASLHA